MGSVSVTIVIPCFPNRRFLEAAVAPFLAWQGESIEVIIVDDGCLDPIVSPFADARIKIHRLETNRGPSAARNAGLALARGKYVIFFDADDIPIVPAFATLKAYLERHPNYGLASGYSAGTIDPSDEITFQAAVLGKTAWETASPFELSFGSYNSWMHLTNFIFRRDLFSSNQPFDENVRYNEDTLLIHSLYRRGKIPVISVPTHFHRVHTGSYCQTSPFKVPLRQNLPLVLAILRDEMLPLAKASLIPRPAVAAARRAFHLLRSLIGVRPCGNLH